jgi:hypothetical protein
VICWSWQIAWTLKFIQLLVWNPWLNSNFSWCFNFQTTFWSG